MKDRARKRRKLPITSLPRVTVTVTATSTPSSSSTYTNGLHWQTNLKPETQDGTCSRANPSKRPGVARGSSAHPRASAAVIRRYHVLLKRKAQLLKLKHVPRVNSGNEEGSRNGNGSGSGVTQELKEIENEIEAMGGLEAYQRMSAIGQSGERGGGAEKVCIAWLIEVGVREAMKKEKGKMRYVTRPNY